MIKLYDPFECFANRPLSGWWFHRKAGTSPSPEEPSSPSSPGPSSVFCLRLWADKGHKMKVIGRTINTELGWLRVAPLTLKTLTWQEAEWRCSVYSPLSFSLNVSIWIRKGTPFSPPCLRMVNSVLMQ